MKIFRSRAAVSLATLAALTMTASPAFARDRDHWRHRHHHGGGVDGGDLLAGVLIVGGIAAIASAASNAKEQRDVAPYRYPGGPEAGTTEGGRYTEQGPDEPAYGAQGRDDEDDAPVAGDEAQEGVREDAAPQRRFDDAVDACSSELARGDHRVDSVEAVRRMGERLSVEGRLSDGNDFACSIDDTGHVRSMSVDGQAMI